MNSSCANFSSVADFCLTTLFKVNTESEQDTGHSDHLCVEVSATKRR